MTGREKILFTVFIALLLAGLTGLNILMCHDQYADAAYYRREWSRRRAETEQQLADIQESRERLRQSGSNAVAHQKLPMDTLSIGEAYRQRFLDHAITLTRYSMSGTPAEGTIDFSAAGTSAAWAAYLESANQEAMPGALVSWYIRVRNERIESTLKVRYKDE